jgi:hypothetical protein
MYAGRLITGMGAGGATVLVPSVRRDTQTSMPHPLIHTNNRI